MGTTVEYKKGDVFLTKRYEESEVLYVTEILDVSQASKAIKIYSGWVDAATFHAKVYGKLGHMEEKGWWIFKKKVLVKE